MPTFLQNHLFKVSAEEVMSTWKISYITVCIGAFFLWPLEDHIIFVCKDGSCYLKTQNFYPDDFAGEQENVITRQVQ